MAYMDEMAGVVGCLPKPWEYMLRDWRLAFSLIFKANLPYIYRFKDLTDGMELVKLLLKQNNALTED
uniref:Uncharacterized protein n=1 Tax=Ditylenchus dipsaci TaxID=166011 RepID=A0A915E8A3_9BILA